MACMPLHVVHPDPDPGRLPPHLLRT
jgi:hypothetical protein